MMRFLYLLLIACLTFSQTQSQTVISYTLLKSFNKTQVDSVLNANGIPAMLVGTKFAVNIYKVLYKTPYKHPDSLVQASGALALPVGVECGVPIAMWGHGTESRTSTAASGLKGGQWQLGMGFAATGYAVALPDYLGMGDKDPKVIIHPYQHAYHEANTGVNMLRATREISDSTNVALNGQIFLFGYSQGGYVTAAVAKEIQTNLSSEFQITAAAPMSGSYDLDGAQYDLMKSDSAYATPGYLPYLTLGYNSVLGNLFNSPSDIFKDPYDTLLPPKFYSGTFSIGAINQLCNPVPKKMFKDSIINEIFADSMHPFRVVLRDNNLVKGWVPQFPMRLYYCSGDEQVTSLNSEVAYNTWTAGGAPSLTKQDFGNYTHGDCAQYTVLSSKEFFDSLKIACTTGIKELGNTDISVFPNPANNKLSIKLKDVTEQTNISILSVTGILQKTVAADKSGTTQMDVANLSAGVYIIRVAEGSNISTRRFVKY